MRINLFLLVGVSLIPVLARAQDVTEQQALQLLSESPRSRALGLQIELARSAARTEGLPPNGSVTFSREDAAGVPETYLFVQQPLSITGRRQFVRRAAEAAAEGEGFTVRSHLHDLRVDLRLAFMDLLLAQQQVSLFRSDRERLAEIVEILRKRESAGESSGYDRIRAGRELSLLLADQESAEARLQGARARLTSFFDPLQSRSDPIAAAGTLLLPQLPDMNALISRSVNRADIRAEHQSVASSDFLMQAARRKLYPEPVVSAGLKSPAVGGRRDSGYLLSVTVPLPLFDRGKADLIRAEAARRTSQARADAIAVEVRTKVAGVWQETQARIRAAESFQARAMAETDDLVRIATAAYEGGEVGILELLDALRTQRESRLRIQDLTGAARRSALELERLVGEEVIP